MSTHASGELIAVPPSPPGLPGTAAGVRSGEWVDVEYATAPRRSLREYLWVLYKYRWLGAVCFVSTLGLVLLVTLMSARVYTAATRLLVSRESSIQLRLEEDILNLQDPDRNVNGASSFLATQVAVLRSRDLAERVIRTQRLAENDAFLQPSPERQGLIAIGAGLLGSVRPRGLAGEWTVAAESEQAGVREVDPTVLDRYLGYLNVQEVRGTDLVEVSFTTPSPSLSALLAAAHTQAYLEAAEETKVANDVAANQFLDRQLRQSREQVERAEGALSRFAAEHPNVAVNQEQKVVGQLIAQASQAFSEAESGRIRVQSLYEFLSRDGQDPLPYFLGTATSESAAQGIQRLHLALIDAGVRRATLADRLGPNHPQMIEISRQASEIRRQLDLELERELSAARDRLAAARLHEDAMRKKLGGLERSATELQALGARYDLLQTDVENARALHESLLKQQIETAVHSDLFASNVRVVERAEVPQSPSKPNVPFNLAFGAAAGLLVALGAVVACERFDNSVKTSKEVEGLLNLPPLAIIRNFAIARRAAGRRRSSGRGESRAAPAALVAGDGAAGARRELIVVHEPWSVVSEAFRSLRTSVLFSTPGAPPKVLLVTSAGMGEGKTVISTNLAATLAESGSRVLLIDGDMRHPSCHPSLGVDNARGLSSFLTGQLPLEEVMHALERPHLWFVAAGPTPPNPAELLGSTRMREALASLRDRFDFVIVDSPPVIPVTDGVVLSREVDGVVLVVKGHDTPREMVRRARDSLQLAGAHLLGVVINNVDFGWGDFFHYDRYYGYYASSQPALETAEGRA